jgi:hypothetical protein
MRFRVSEFQLLVPFITWAKVPSDHCISLGRAGWIWNIALSRRLIGTPHSFRLLLGLYISLTIQFLIPEC